MSSPSPVPAAPGHEGAPEGEHGDGREIAPDRGASAVDRLVDWRVAARTADRLTSAGPVVTRDEAAEAVAQLRTAAAQSIEPVAGTARLRVPAGPDAVVIDRARWVRANIENFRGVLGPAVAEAFALREREGGSGPSSRGLRWGRVVTGLEVGSLLAFLSSRVLGQYDVFARDGAGRLLLVAPNVVHVERELDVDPADFRLWVCLHEETHRVQFGAAPWLADHLASAMRGLVVDMLGRPGDVSSRLVGALREVPGVVRGTPGSGGGATSMLDLVQTPEQRDRVAALTAVMSLLEGHADVVMDDVGPQVVPSVARIRERFTRRRRGAGPLDQAVRRMLGLEAKMRQYRDGAVFVRGVTSQVGVDGFNAVWAEAANLPSVAEIADPRSWVRRVHR